MGKKDPYKRGMRPFILKTGIENSRIYSRTYRKKLRQELLPYSYLKRNESKSAESGVTAPDVQNFMRGEIVVFQLSDI